METKEARPKKKFYKKWWFWVIAIIVAIGALGSGGEENTDVAKDTPSTPVAADTAKPAEDKKEEPKKVEAIKVSAVDLAAAYEGNEVKADKTYKDKAVEVTGKVKDIGVILGQTYVVLSSGKDFSITDVQCFFKDKAEIDKVAELNKGDTVTITGEVDGKSMNVGINDCILIK